MDLRRTQLREVQVMSFGILAAYFGAWFCCSLLSGMLDMTYLGATNTVTIWTVIFKTFAQTGTTGTFSWINIILNTDWFSALWNTFTWDFCYLQGDWAILRLAYIAIFAVPICLMVIIGIVSAFSQK